MARVRDGVARRCAREVIRDASVSSLPVNVEAVATSRGLQVIERGGFPDGHFGALARMPNSSGYAIVVSKSCPTGGHRRFTVAHELGHYVIPGHHDALFSADRDIVFSPGWVSRKKNPLEIEADAFASELVHPRPLLQPLVSAISEPGIGEISALADATETSLSSAGITFARLTDLPVAVVLTHAREIEWLALSEPLFSQSWASVWRTKGMWAPRGSATHRLSEEAELIAAGGLEEDGGTFADWFDDAPPIEIVEEAAGLGRFGRVLTVLWAPGFDPDADEEEAW